jgi:hypothetical protein
MGLMVVVAGGVAMAACEGDFVTDPTRPRPTRALQNPYDRSSGNNEVMVQPTGAVPLVAVDFANNKDEQPKVTTILDPLRGAQGVTERREPATRPAAVAPATTQPQVGVESGATVNTQQVKVVAQRRTEDGVAIASDAEGNVRLTVTSPSGIGGLTLERINDAWPAVIHVQLQKSGVQPFKALEGFSAAEETETGRRVELKTRTVPAEGRADVNVPGFVRSPRIIIEWVDYYR